MARNHGSVLQLIIKTPALGYECVGARLIEDGTGVAFGVVSSELDASIVSVINTRDGNWNRIAITVCLPNDDATKSNINVNCPVLRFTPKVNVSQSLGR